MLKQEKFYNPKGTIIMALFSFMTGWMILFQHQMIPFDKLQGFQKTLALFIFLPPVSYIIAIFCFANIIFFISLRFYINNHNKKIGHLNKNSN